ncbi:MAG TPA: hypothetical protein VFN83_09035 [Gemmatimonadales bacterium]|nr:hypothetical protein [Gemmatimonadales bacterium]
MSVFDGLKARLERLFAEAPEQAGASLRDAVIEMRVGVAAMREALDRAERELAGERSQLDDAVRRRGLAENIGDTETMDVAARFSARHQERVAVLERKVAVQRDELALAERELEEMTTQLRARMPGQGARAPDSIERAWQDIAAAGGARPDLDLEGELLKADAERKLREAAVEAQLAHLKRKLGRDG